jgi:8-amino-7-oxononanoate synthase
MDANLEQRSIMIEDGMARPNSLDEYMKRRLRAAGGSMAQSASYDDALAAVKDIYFKPMEALEVEGLSTSGQFVSFANYDYLGLGADQRVRRAAATAALERGVGAGASRLVGGSRSVHDDLERDMAAFLGVEDCISLVSGYLTNASLIGHLLARSDQVFIDDLSHNSIVFGTEASRAKTYRFAHNDLDDLERQLESRRAEGKRALIAVEGLYSMDGDIPDLPRLLELRRRYDAWLLVDEAHSIGVLGRTGRGISEHFGTDPGEIDFIVGTLSKTFGGSGGFIAGRQGVIDGLRFTLPAFIFSVGLSPVVAAAVNEALAILRIEPWRVTQLQDNARLFIEGARARGLNVGEAVGAAVTSILFSSHEQCMAAANALLRAGYYAPPIPQLAVPTNQPRIRFFISARHEPAQINGVLDVLKQFQDMAPIKLSERGDVKRDPAEAPATL